MKQIIGLLLIVTSLCSCNDSRQKPSSVNDLTVYVDPYIGTGGHGHTFLGVAAPFGAVQLGPSNINKGWDWCSAYHYSDSVVIGFAHLHLSGTGCSDTGDILFMPYTGNEMTDKGSQNDTSLGYGSHYSHKNETAKVGYYSVLLEDYNIKVELTASERVGFHQYTYPANAQEKRIMINLKEANGDDRVLESYMEQLNDTTVCGYRFSTGWAKGVQEVFFTAIFSKPVKLQLYDDNKPVNGNSLTAVGVKGNLSVTDNNILVKVGLSPVSTDNALKNISQEIPHWDFQHIVSATTGKWENELSKITVESNDSVAKRIFYTAMYHAFLQPNLFNDVDNDYRGTDGQVYENASFPNYTVFSLWDTYRAAHPLYTIVQPERVPDFVKTMLAIYDQQGCLPVWHLYGSDTYEMIGIQSVPVVADAILKGFNSFNYEQAFNAMKQSMLSDYKGLNYLKTGNYIPSDLEKESVAKGLEYAIADWSIAQVAKKLGKEDDYKLFSERAMNYKNYWDNNTRFFRGKNADGSWRKDFDPYSSKHRSDDYCEGNAWQYLWLVPHDVDGLVELLGGKEAFIQKLDSLFILDSNLGEEASPDISGLIGQYAQGNEPGHHTIYLYSMVGQQWKTAEKARYILKNLYHDTPDGLHGNEDCGQMSSWYIFSALGFYPVNPADGIYVIGSPLFDKAVLKLPDNKTFEIEAVNNIPENKYIQSVKLNGESYNNAFIKHEDIMKGGKMKFVMGPTPNKSYGIKQ